MNESQIIIRHAELADLDKILEIENASFSDPWSESMFLSHFNSKIGVTLIALVNDEICGYVNAYVIAGDENGEYGEFEIANIAVSPDFRRMHIGDKLIEVMSDIASKERCTKAFLEVRESNHPAQRLYLKNGFVVTGIRKNYYSNPRENAILMMREI